MKNHPTITTLLAAALLVPAGLLQACDRDNDQDDAVSFRVTIENVSAEYPIFEAGAFDTPQGASTPGPLLPGESYVFTVHAGPGHRLSFATMMVQSNDLFFAPDADGIALFDAAGAPLGGDRTDEVLLWDAGTEVNQRPGTGSHQAPRQSGPDTGGDESSGVAPVDDGFDYPAPNRVLRVTITPLE
jgi:hypothetical protein